MLERLALTVNAICVDIKWFVQKAEYTKEGTGVREASFADSGPSDRVVMNDPSA